MDIMMYSSLDVLFVVLSLPAAWGTFSVYKLGEDTDVSMIDHPPGRGVSRVGEARRAWGDGWRMSSCRLSISGTTMCACAESSVAGRLLYLQPNGRVYQQKISTLASICPWIRTKGATPWFLCILPSK